MYQNLRDERLSGISGLRSFLANLRIFPATTRLSFFLGRQSSCTLRTVSGWVAKAAALQAIPSMGNAAALQLGTHGAIEDKNVATVLQCRHETLTPRKTASVSTTGVQV